MSRERGANRATGLVFISVFRSAQGCRGPEVLRDR